MQGDLDDFLINGPMPKRRHLSHLTYEEESKLSDEVAVASDQVEQEKLESDINRLMNKAKDGGQ